jgi:hypothetical protein
MPVFARQEWGAERVMVADRAQVWFRDVIAELRELWKSDLPWDRVIALRDRLQATLDRVVDERRKTRPKAGRLCSRCGGEMRPVITVRAVLFAAGRFAGETDETVSSLDEAWAQHRALHNLDGYGRPKEAAVAAGHARVERQSRARSKGLANKRLHRTKVAGRVRHDGRLQ